MKLSYEWLKEYVDLNVSAEELAKGLTMSGSEVESIHEAGSDKIMGLEITSNRPDCLNMIGLAREASAVFDKDLKMPEFKIAKEVPVKGVSIECAIKSAALCPKYTARIIQGVNVKPSSEKIRKRIEALGLRPVNNVVDITNYCLMELGQPMHAFDLDKVKGGKIVVREAKDGEKIVTIDGVERKLEKGMLVIADAERVIAIAGVMGGKDTEVSSATKNILLESAYFDPVSVRRTARRLALPSDSSYRFERGVDKGMIRSASDRAAALIVKEAGGEISCFFETGDLRIAERVIDLDVDKVSATLGVAIDREKAKKILARLGMSVLREKGPVVSVAVPSFREDLHSGIDLVEEVARIFGYHMIPATLPPITPAVERKTAARKAKERIAEALVDFGLNEIMTYSLIGDAAAKRFPGLSGEEAVVLANPISEDHKVMTPHLLDGMLKAVSWNLNRKNNDLMLFEIGKLYSKTAGGKGYKEIPALSIGMTGMVRSNWLEGARKAGFYDVKGSLEAVFSALRVTPEFTENGLDGIMPSSGIKIKGESQLIGYAGEVAKKILKDYDIEQEVFVAQIKLDSLLDKAALDIKYRPVPRFPFSTRDVSVLCDEALASDKVLEIISGSGEELVKEVNLLDVYKGKNIPDGKKSLTYSIKYGLDNRTLRDEEIEAAHSKIKDTLVSKLKVSFR